MNSIVTNWTIKLGKKNQGIGVFINIEKEIIIIVWP